MLTTRKIKKGSIDQSVYMRFYSLSTGLMQASMPETQSGLGLTYHRFGAPTAVAISAAAVSFLSSAHVDGGFEPIMDGWYRVDLPDAAVAAGAAGVLISGIAAGINSHGALIELTDYNPSTNDGSSSTPNRY